MPEEFTDLEAQILAESPADTPVVLGEGDLNYDGEAPQHGEEGAPRAGGGAMDD
ncbi:MAG: hypothetical protein M3P34_03675 [Actinomycetota bacterium]|nr:hypothetical protein [Actinomycetota bacterium]